MEGWGVFHFIVNEIYRVEGCYMVMDADGLFGHLGLFPYG